MISAKLQAAYNANRIVVRKLTSGEVIIKFHALAKIPDFTISNDKPVDLLARKNMTIEKLKRSNLAALISAQVLDIA